MKTTSKITDKQLAALRALSISRAAHGSSLNALARKGLVRRVTNGNDRDATWRGGFGKCVNYHMNDAGRALLAELDAV